MNGRRDDSIKVVQNPLVTSGESRESGAVSIEAKVGARPKGEGI